MNTRTGTALTKSEVIEVMSDEYRTLREESLQGITARHQIITVALGALSVIIAGLVSEKQHPLVIMLTCYVLVPFLCKAFLLMWLGEYRRSARAGHAIRSLEARINTVAGRVALTWETTLSRNRQHMALPYSVVVIVFTASSCIGEFIGIFFAGDFAASYPWLKLQSGDTTFFRIPLSPLLAVAVTVSGLALIAFLVEGWFMLKQVKEIAKEIQNYMEP